ncbi:hypothetical protein [Thermoleptolyngbya sp. M55_K2018_002]|uniref:hypothetical protein n=1 Tax=Thermoleptolyngbya sp. M55_K2018_002 TaxID=2747808 RepID=UPI0025E4B405|nr:hypothetical protein [Thermoleptolyngbya sp. M55_K2018_002]
MHNPPRFFTFLNFTPYHIALLGTVHLPNASPNSSMGTGGKPSKHGDRPSAGITADSRFAKFQSGLAAGKKLSLVTGRSPAELPVVA